MLATYSIMNVLHGFISGLCLSGALHAATVRKSRAMTLVNLAFFVINGAFALGWL